MKVVFISEMKQPSISGWRTECTIKQRCTMLYTPIGMLSSSTIWRAKVKRISSIQTMWFATRIAPKVLRTVKYL